jgi:hypothetical protein
MTERTNHPNLICRCGHKQSSHREIDSHNYTAGKCRECDCENFVIEKDVKRMITKQLNPYYEAFLIANDYPVWKHNADFFAWINKKHTEFRKMHSLPLHGYSYNDKEEQLFIKYINNKNQNKNINDIR